VLDSQVPLKIPLPWAASAGIGYITYPVPTLSQQGITNGAASFTDGFPPDCFIPIGAGGAGPFGKDFNGLFQQITAGLQWVQAGGPWKYDATFQTAIGGYPNNAVVASAVQNNLFWISTVDNNLTNPDTGGAGWLIWPIYRLQSFLTYYVATTGSDSNPGTLAAPWLTLQHAVDVIQNGYFLNGYSVTINVAAGTYSAGAALSGSLNGSINFVGPSSGTAIINGSGYCFSVINSATCLLSGNFSLNQTNASGQANACVVAGTGGVVTLSGTSGGSRVQFGTAQTYHMNAFGGGRIGMSLSPNNVYWVTGNASVGHWNAQELSNILMNGASIDIFNPSTGFTTFATATNLSLIEASGITFTGNPGTATGARYSITANSVINTSGGGASYFPGNSAGSSASGGQYI
jgi:hypothetical protein